MNQNEKKPRVLKGTVVSNKMQKTIVVRIDRLKKDPKYQKYMKTSTRFKAHDETNSAGMGDIVMIRETRPMSKDKRWVLEGVVTKAPEIPEIPADNIEA